MYVLHLLSNWYYVYTDMHSSIDRTVVDLVENLSLWQNICFASLSVCKNYSALCFLRRLNNLLRPLAAHLTLIVLPKYCPQILYYWNYFHFLHSWNNYRNIWLQRYRIGFWNIKNITAQYIFCVRLEIKISCSNLKVIHKIKIPLLTFCFNSWNSLDMTSSFIL